MSDLKSLGYVKVQTTDIHVGVTSRSTYWVSPRASGPDQDALYLRMDERAARIIVVPGDTDKIVTVGWEVRDHAALERVKATLDAAGVAVQGTVARPRPTPGGSRRSSPSTTRRAPPSEVFHGAVLDHSPVVTPFGARFVTGEQGLGHVVLPALDVPGLFEFYTEVLGFKSRGAFRVPDATGVRTAAGEVPRYQRAPPQPGDLPGHDAARPGSDPPDGRGRQSRRRRSGAGPGQQGRLPVVLDTGPAHQRQDGVVLRARSWRLGHRVRHRRYARRRNLLHRRGNHRRQLLGPRVGRPTCLQRCAHDARRRRHPGLPHRRSSTGTTRPTSSSPATASRAPPPRSRPPAAGADVLVLERTGSWGGAASMAGGFIYLGGGTPLQKACGFDDSVDNMAAFLNVAMGPGADENRIADYCEGSVEHFDWLVECGVPFKAEFFGRTRLGADGRRRTDVQRRGELLSVQHHRHPGAAWSRPADVEQEAG